MIDSGDGEFSAVLQVQVQQKRIYEITSLVCKTPSNNDMMESVQRYKGSLFFLATHPFTYAPIYFVRVFVIIPSNPAAYLDCTDGKTPNTT